MLVLLRGGPSAVASSACADIWQRAQLPHTNCWGIALQMAPGPGAEPPRSCTLARHPPAMSVHGARAVHGQDRALGHVEPDASVGWVVGRSGATSSLGIHQVSCGSVAQPGHRC